MINNNFIKKDKKIRNLIYKKQKIKKVLNIIKTNSIYNNKLKYLSNLIINKMILNSNLVKANNRCFITGRSRSVYKNFNLSRITLKELTLSQNISGLQKYSY